MANSISVQTTFPSDSELENLFGTVPKLEYYKVLDKTVDAGGKIVAERAKQLAPRSDKTGTSKKRSKNQRNSADWNFPLRNTIKKVTRKYSGVKGISVIGPEWPRGNKAYFNTSPKGRKVYYWGKNAEKTAAQIRNWIVQSFDETQPQQLEAMKTALTETVDKLMRG